MKRNFVYVALICLGIFGINSFAQSEESIVSEMVFTQPADQLSSVTVTHNIFEGYTNHWEKNSWKWYRSTGLFLMSQPEVQSELWQMEDEIGNQLLLEELYVQKGFVNKLAGKTISLLQSPSSKELAEALNRGDVLLQAIDRDEVMKDLLSKLPEDLQYRRNRAFYLTNGDRTLFIISCQTIQETERLSGYVNAATEIIKRYSLYKGMPGVSCGYLTITQDWKHPLDVVSIAMDLRCSWVMVEGYDDWMTPAMVKKWLGKINVPFVYLSGQSGNGGVMYGMERYPQIQDNTFEQCLEWTEKYKGYFFRYLSGAGDKNASRYTGYLVRSMRDQDKIDELKAPFITGAGSIGSRIPTTMVLFMEKNKELSLETIMGAIKDRKAVALFERAQMLGPKELRDPLRLLLLDREYLDKSFLEQADVKASVQGENLQVTVHNKTGVEIKGNLIFEVPAEITVGDNVKNLPVTLTAWETRTLTYPLRYTEGAAGETNPIAVVLNTGEAQIRSLTHLDIPNTVELHEVILDVPGTLKYPVTIWNYSQQKTIEATLEVTSTVGSKQATKKTINVEVEHGKKFRTQFEISLESGEYSTKVTALGKMAEGKISIRAQSGQATVHEEDMNKDGIPEIVLENAKIRATILLFGGRVIEYIEKSRNENLLFKLWPTLPPWANQPRGYRAFYPWGGLEEFLGYPYIGGQIVYKYDIEKNSGNYVRVKVWANVHGSKIEKIVTLFSESPVLEVRYAFNDIDPNINIVGINPLVQIGSSTGPEDVYYFPMDSIETRSPRLDKYYGSIFPLREGWVAGYDTQMNISLVVGYPVNSALFMHLWNNHPDNTPTPYYYTELQPWVFLKPGTTTYFTYYLYGRDGGWKPALEEFKNLGIFTKAKNPIY